MHTASPFPLAEPKDPQDLIRPAVDGTLRALKAAKAAGINRVILTSSNAAIYKDANKSKDAASDERNWTSPDESSVGAYEASKTLAERAAWDFVAGNVGMALTTINPGAVFGPAMDRRYGTSLEIVERMMSGKDPVAPPMELPLVDVRDVAMMHVAAIDLDATKGERFSATADTLRFVDMCRMLKDWDALCIIGRGRVTKQPHRADVDGFREDRRIRGRDGARCAEAVGDRQIDDILFLADLSATHPAQIVAHAHESHIAGAAGLEVNAQDL